MDGTEALQGGGGEGDTRRAADILHLLQLIDTPLEHTVETSLLIASYSCKLWHSPYSNLFYCVKM